jgi:hypothetical protein
MREATMLQSDEVGEDEGLMGVCKGTTQLA